MPRKTTGCWTCRFRKKKCDDTRPACLSCTSRLIECYGYGPKPEWMDGGLAEREVMQSLKLRIKASYSQRRRQRSKASLAQISQRSSMNQTSEATDLLVASPWSRLDTTIYSDHMEHSSIQEDEESQINPRSYRLNARDTTRIGRSENYSSPTPSINQLSPTSSNTSLRPWFPYSERDMSLVMYYLDHIFPRLCPFFKYSAADSGRGWILNLFLRSKPLCAAAVCISACDQAQFVLGPLSNTPGPNRHDLELQHIQIVADLRDHLRTLSENSGALQMSAVMEALACIMHLILFELWIPQKGLTNDWRMHLEAANVLLVSVAYKASQGTTGNSPATDLYNITGDDEIAHNFPVNLLSNGERQAFEFYLTQYTYCFVCSAASLGLTPQSLQSVKFIQSIYHPDQHKLRDMLGCEDWVMIALLDIAILREWKKDMQNEGALSLRELTRRADTIEKRLTQGLATPDSGQSFAKSDKEEEQDMITTIFLHSCSILLHVVVSGLYPNLPEIRQAVLQTIEALEYMRDHSEIKYPSWPYCVAGCLALESDYDRVRALCPPPKKGTHPPVLADWTLDIIEECWKTRETQNKNWESPDWCTAMNHLGTRLLLV